MLLYKILLVIFYCFFLTRQSLAISQAWDLSLKATSTPNHDLIKFQSKIKTSNRFSVSNHSKEGFNTLQTFLGFLPYHSF